MTRPPAARLRRAPAPGIALACALACACAGPATDDTGATTSTTGASSTGETDALPAPPTPSPTCSAAPTISQGRYFGSLRGVGSEAAGPCAEPGPSTYLRVAADLHVDLRITAVGVGFTPRVEIADDACVLGLPLVCGDDGGATLSDALPGSTWLVRIGAAADDPALASPAPEDGAPDPLAFTVDVAQVLVLDPGDVCSDDADARCPAGTLCAATDDPDDDPTLRVCTLLAGDTCERAETLVIDALSGSFEVDREAPQTDAHAHSCAGAGARERVLRADLAADFPAGAQLILATAAVDIDLAARAPSCDVSDELACAIGGPEGASLTIDDPAALAAAGQRPWIFVEWPADAVGGATIEWSVVGE